MQISHNLKVYTQGMLSPGDAPKHPSNAQEGSTDNDV